MDTQKWVEKRIKIICQEGARSSSRKHTQFLFPGSTIGRQSIASKKGRKLIKGNISKILRKIPLPP